MSLYTPQEQERLKYLRDKHKAQTANDEEQQEMLVLVQKGFRNLKVRLQEIDEQLDQRQKEHPWIFKLAKFLARLKNSLGL